MVGLEEVLLRPQGNQRAAFATIGIVSALVAVGEELEGNQPKEICV
jgi:hypothetical protein